MDKGKILEQDGANKNCRMYPTYRAHDCTLHAGNRRRNEQNGGVILGDHQRNFVCLLCAQMHVSHAQTY